MVNSILLVDHDETTSAILKQKFQIKGYTIFQSFNGQDVLKNINRYTPDCIVLEIGLPDIDGVELCKSIKAYTECPVVFHTNCNNDQDEIRALLAGADDYVAKSKRFNVLYQRIQRLIQSAPNTKNKAYNFGLFHFNHQKFHCSFQGEKIPFSSDEFELLHFFLKNIDMLITRETLFRSLKNKEYDGKSRRFDTSIFRLQAKMKNANMSDNVFTCIRGKGYVLNKSQLAHAHISA